MSDNLGSSAKQMKDVAESSGLSSRKKLRALIVDDNKVIRKILKGHLSGLGVDTQEATNGLDAVDIFARGAKFDIVLMDKEMPVMDGPEATRVLRSMGVTTKIMGMSVSKREEDIDEFVEAGIQAFYVKPLTLRHLIDIMKEVDRDL